MAGIGNQVRLPYLFSGDIRSARDLDASLSANNRRPPAIVAVDLADLTLADLEAWVELARMRGLPVVIGLDARSRAGCEHALPELMLSHLASSADRVRFAALGVRTDGTLSHGMIVDLDPETLVVSAFDPTNEQRGDEPPADADLVDQPETTWATRTHA